MATGNSLPTASERAEVDRANASGRTPVVFVHGLWLLDSSWDRWATFFEERGYVAVTPGWPDDPEVVARTYGRARLRDRSVADVAAHQQAVIERLEVQPALVGHSFGGVVAEALAGNGLAAVTVAIAPAMPRTVLPDEIVGVGADRVVRLSFDQFRSRFANAVTEVEARRLYDTIIVPGSGVPLFVAALASIDTTVDERVIDVGPHRGPMLIVSGEIDLLAPEDAALAAHAQHSAHPYAVTELVRIPGRGHSLTIDSGWQLVAEITLQFINRFVS